MSTLRTVYVLGAGFSAAGGMPLQSELLAHARRLTLLDVPAQPFGVFAEAQDKAARFMQRVFPSPNPRLEDVFTLLDQAVAQRETVLGFPWEEIDAIREGLKTTVLFALRAASAKAIDRTFYRRLALQWLLDAVSGNGPDIISLNWDSLLEDSLFEAAGRAGGAVDVNYCCDTEPLDDSPHTPSLRQVGGKKMTLRVLKLHGSVNWLHCPSCKRLFTSVGSRRDLWAHYTTPRTCARCPHANAGVEVQLRTFMVTPTFLKAFDNVHIQSTWHQAALVLREAEHIVFVGYSLPEADFHFRALLRRSVRATSRVSAVMLQSDLPPRNTPSRLKFGFASERFREFFGARLDVSTQGTLGYFTERLQTLAHLRRRLRRTGIERYA